MNSKKFSLIVFSLIVSIGVLVGAKPEKSVTTKSPVVIGEVLDVQKSEDGSSTMITVQGFMKEKEVSKISIIGIIDNKTKVMNSSNDKKENITIEKGDLVYMRVNEAMTKSNPPQTIIKRLFITKNK